MFAAVHHVHHIHTTNGMVPWYLPCYIRTYHWYILTYIHTYIGTVALLQYNYGGPHHCTFAERAAQAKLDDDHQAASFLRH